MSTATGQYLRRISTGVAAILVGYTSLYASEPTGIRPMIIYSDVAGANEILSKEYDDAIDIMLLTRGRGETRILLANNLCVAYTLTGQLESAHVACDNAVHQASLRRNYGDDWFTRYASFRTQRLYKSRAFANRSVLRMVSGDTTGATRDLELAVALDRLREDMTICPVSQGCPTTAK